ncbi:MAG: glycerophosphodiester phosphodiesterase [Verrucomicrobiales bacterium]|nr:glycerophosphodiester phosphodiesterase [Verrucomicrobiales bacterium]
MKPSGPAPLLVLLSALLLPAMGGGVEIIGHRGASHDAPENTLASFRLCWEQQADAGELDIHLSRDGEAVVIHDGATKRVTGVDKPVVQQTREELQAQDAGRWKDPKFAGEKIPLLSEVLALIPEGRRMFLEIKCGPEALGAIEKAMQKSGRKAQQFVIIGFNHATMKAAKKRFPKLPVLWLVSHAADKTTGQFPDLDRLISQAKEAGLDGLDLEYKFPLDAAAVAKTKAAGLQLFVWTVNEAAAAQALARAGVDGITTDRPAWLREQLRH